MQLLNRYNLITFTDTFQSIALQYRMCTPSPDCLLPIYSLSCSKHLQTPRTFSNKSSQTVNRCMKQVSSNTLKTQRLGQSSTSKLVDTQTHTNTHAYIHTRIQASLQPVWYDGFVSSWKQAFSQNVHRSD